MTPFFSVVIPTFNRAERLKETIASVLGQTFPYFELLVMDDGSTDGTEAMVEAFNDSRIRYEWSINSGGPATPRNRGIDRATADWISFLDADDLWLPDKLERVAKFIGENPSADLICHDVITSLELTGERFLSRCGPFERDLYRVMLTQGNQVITSATTVRRQFLNQYNLRFNMSPDFVIVEDYDLWLRIARVGGKFSQISRPLGVYVIESENISSNLTKFNRNHLTLLKEHVFELQNFEKNKARLWREINAHLLLDGARSQIADGKLASGFRSILRGFRGAPLSSARYIASKYLRRIRKCIL